MLFFLYFFINNLFFLKNGFCICLQGLRDPNFNLMLSKYYYLKILIFFMFFILKLFNFSNLIVKLSKDLIFSIYNITK
jgi:hypothetical protein